MRMMLVVAALGSAAAASAATSDRVAYRAIVSGDFAAAAARLEGERRIHPQRPELMLNLAAAYARIRRQADARALYAEVLARPVAMMDLSSGAVVSSHDVANRGLTRLAPAIASR